MSTTSCSSYSSSVSRQLFEQGLLKQRERQEEENQTVARMEATARDKGESASTAVAAVEASKGLSIDTYA